MNVQLARIRLRYLFFFLLAFLLVPFFFVAFFFLVAFFFFVRLAISTFPFHFSESLAGEHEHCIINEQHCKR